MTAIKSAINTVERSDKLMTAAMCLIFIGTFSLMLSVPCLNKAVWFAGFLVILSKTWRQSFRTILVKDTVIISSLILLLLFSVGFFYSLGSWHYSFSVWDKYLKLIYLVIFIPLFLQQSTRTSIVFAFILGVMVNELLTYLHYFDLLNFGMPSSKHWLFVQDIDSGFIVSYAAYLIANYSLDNKRFRWISLVCFCICTIDILCLNRERTGYFIYFGLAFLFLWQRLRWKGFFIAIILIPLTFSGLYVGSQKFSDRINQVFSNIADYRKGNEITSIGLRLAFVDYSFQVIKKHPLIGVGTGSFQEVYQSLQGPKLDDNTWPSHPHNEYVLILFQLGSLGFIVFCAFIFFQIRAALTLERAERFLLQGLILSFVLLGFCNASLLVNPAGSFYMLFLTILLASKYSHLNTSAPIVRAFRFFPEKSRSSEKLLSSI